MAPLVIDILKTNRLLYGNYVEAFAGGAGLAWKLLLNSYASHVHLNDIDRAIYAFWHTIINRTDELCDRIQSTRISIAEWHRQRAIQNSRYSTLFDLGYSTLYMNRTNRSGIIGGGIIGGLDQTGNFKIGCRFNKKDLIRKIRRIAKYKGQVSLYQMDAKEFLIDILPNIVGPTLVNLDPPYMKVGPELYENHYTPGDHAELADAVQDIDHHWMVTYDDTLEARALYEEFPSYMQPLNYTAQVKRVGVELLVLDPRLTPPPSLDQARRIAP